MQASNNWWKNARMPGALRYHALATGRLLGLVLIVDLIVTLLGALTPLAFPSATVTFAGVAMDIGLWLIFATIVCCHTAGSRTRFLLRYGSSRFAVWLSNVLSLLLWLLLFALGTLIISLLAGLLMGALADGGNASYRMYGMTADASGYAGAVWRSLGDALRRAPRYLFGLVVTISALYLFGCCLRKNKLVTLIVVIGAPLAMFTLLLVPAVREAIDAVQSSSGEAATLAARWYLLLADAAKFIARYLDWITAGVGVACLPLSYWAMRTTAQP